MLALSSSQFDPWPNSVDIRAVTNPPRPKEIVVVLSEIAEELP